MLAAETTEEAKIFHPRLWGRPNYGHEGGIGMWGQRATELLLECRQGLKRDWAETKGLCKQGVAFHSTGIGMPKQEVIAHSA